MSPSEWGTPCLLRRPTPRPLFMFFLSSLTSLTTLSHAIQCTCLYLNCFSTLFLIRKEGTLSSRVDIWSVHCRCIEEQRLAFYGSGMSLHWNLSCVFMIRLGLLVFRRKTTEEKYSYHVISRVHTINMTTTFEWILVFVRLTQLLSFLLFTLHSGRKSLKEWGVIFYLASQIATQIIWNSLQEIYLFSLSYLICRGGLRYFWL